MKRIYITGKVTGEPVQECRKKFSDAEQQIKSMGMIAINPMNIVPEGTDWMAAMRLCIRSLVTCDAVYVLPDWKNSKGARLEITIAKHLGLKLIYTWPIKKTTQNVA